MNTSLEIAKQVQALLGVVQDGRLGPQSLAAYRALAAAAPETAWPIVVQASPATAGPDGDASKTPEGFETAASPKGSGLSGLRSPVSGFSPDFLAFVPTFIFEWEGTVWENDPDDGGNKGDGSPGNIGTKYGIDAASHPGINIQALNDATATAVHWRDWLKAGCDKLSSPMAEVFYNCAMNMGLGEARKFAASAGDASSFLNAQEAHYRAIAGANPVEGKYLRGWLNRTQALRKRFNLSA